MATATRARKARRTSTGIASPHHMSDHEVTLTADLVVLVRPDWERWLVRQVLNSHRDVCDAADLARAAIGAASNPDFHNPKAIMWRGRHWDGAATLPPDMTPRARCRVCGKTEDRCAVERPGTGDDHRFEATP